VKKPIVLFAILFFSTLLNAQGSERSGSSEKPFVSGGRIHLQLSAADYDIHPGKGNNITITWQANAQRDLNVSIDVKGTEATITTDGPHSNMHVTIEVPKTSDLWVRLGAGDLSMGAIAGSKDIEMGAGDLRIAVPKGDDYRAVDVSVGAGDINGQVFGKSTGGLFRSLKWSGPGKYSLHVHLRAGDVNIVESESI
jgi:hypothetical protein